MDRAIAGQFDPDHFVTAQMARLDAGSGRLQWVNAGHPHPLLLRDRRVVRVLHGPTTLPAGIGGATPHVSEEQLEPGDRVLFFTDGIIEERMTGGERFGVEVKPAGHLQPGGCGGDRRLGQHDAGTPGW